MPEPTKFAIDEEIIWSYKKEKGIFKRTIKEAYFLTDRRVAVLDGWIYWDKCDAIFVMNRRSSSQGVFAGQSAGGHGSRTSVYTGSSGSRQIGDVVFTYDGKPYVTFRQIPDPDGIIKQAKALQEAYCRKIKAQ